MAKTAPSRISGQKILGDLRLAAKKGDRAALTLALDQMRTLAHSPKYWEKYLTLLRNPLARLVDMLLIKQGERIAHQKGWKLPKTAPPSEKPRRPTKAAKARARARVVVNPAAGGGRTARAWRRLRDLVAATLPADHAETRGPGDGERLAREAAAAGAPLVVAVGGDGTLNEVVNGVRTAGRGT